MSKPDSISGRSVRSVILTEFGGFDKIKIQEINLTPSVCGEEDIEVEVTYCGVNFADLYLRQGLIPDAKLPQVLGLECVGIVHSVGNKVENLRPGDRVLCYRGEGGLYRNCVILHKRYCFPLPGSIEDRIAVALPANYLTASFSLFDIGNLQPGQKVLIHSCAGGVGWAATQLAKTVENVIIVGTASPSKHFEVKNNGVDYVISSENYLKELKADHELNEFKFDVIIDSIGGSNISVSMSLLNTCGKTVVIGANQMVIGEQKFSKLQLLKLWWNTKHIPVLNLITNNCAMAGLHLTNLMEKTPEKVSDRVNNLLAMFNEGKIKPRIDSEFPLLEITKAMKKLASRENIGKVIVKI